MATSMPNLSLSDNNTLALLFNNETSTTPTSTTPSNSRLIDPTLPPPDPPLQALELSILAPLNIPNPSKEVLQNALYQLTNLIGDHPTYASAYNNRAQTARLLHGSSILVSGPAFDAVYSDLYTAIHVASPAPMLDARVSPFTAKVLGSAFTQRGAVLLQCAESLGDGETARQEESCTPGRGWPNELEGKNKKTLEEMANADFEMGGQYGNEVGKEMAKRTNVWAKMCGAIVQKVMKAEMGSGEEER